jgi:anti-anti-sigma factor
MSLEISVGLSAGHAMAAVRGELDIVSSPDAISAIASVTMRRRVAIVELSELETIDCSALGALAESAEAGQAERTRCAAGSARGEPGGGCFPRVRTGRTHVQGCASALRIIGVIATRPLEASADRLMLAQYPAVPVRTLLLYADA